MDFTDPNIAIIEGAQRAGAIADTGVIAVYLAGMYQEKNGGTALNKLMGHENYNPIKRFFNRCRIYITPYILAEVQGLLKHRIGDDELAMRIIDFAKEWLIELREDQVKRKGILMHKQLQKYGIVDISALLASKLHKRYLITLDRALEGKAESDKESVLPMKILVAHCLNYPTY